MANQKEISPFDWSPRQVMLATLFVVLVILGFYLLFRFRTVLLALFVAILIGTGIKPAVGLLSRRGIPKIYGELIVFLLIFVAVVAFLLLVMPLLLEQSASITNQMNEYYQQLRSFMVTSRSQILIALGFRLAPGFEVENLVPEPEEGETTPPPTTQNEETVDRVATLFRYAGLAARGAFFTLAVFLMAFYWTLEGDRAIRSILLLVPLSYRDNIREIVGAIEGKLGGFLFGQTLLCLIIGGLSLIAYMLIGLPNALVLAILAGVMEAVPTIGPALGAVPAVLIAASSDPDKILWVVVATAVIQMLENHLLVPRIMDRSVGVHPLLTLLSLAALSSLMGILGALLAIPLAAIFQLLLNRFLLDPLREHQQEPAGRDMISVMRLRAQEIVQDVRKRGAREMNGGNRNEEDLEDENLDEAIEALAADLDRVLSQASPAEREAA